MTKKISGWFKGAAVGCGGLLLLLALSCVAFMFITLRPYHSAVDKQKQVLERFGPRDAFAPSPDGRIPPERLEAFLRVRGRLMELCGDFEEKFGQFDRMDRLGDQEELDRGELTREVFKTMGSAFGIAPLIGRFYEARDGALLEEGMGLGEYAYLYVVAFGPELFEFQDMEGAHIDADPLEGRIREDLLVILKNQFAAAGEPPQGERDEAFLESLRLEIGRLEENCGRIPWQDGPPPPLAASLEPFRERLHSAFCAHTAGLELHRNEARGLNVRSVE